MDGVLLDTCVLLKSYLCDTLLSIAEEGTFRPLWSDHVLAELRRNLIKAGAKQEAVEHRLGQMAAYFSDARVTGYEELISSMTNHPKDRHVLAAAVAGRADILVTENLKDFPPGSVTHLEITVAGQDDFLTGLLELYPDAVLGALRRQASAMMTWAPLTSARPRRMPATRTLAPGGSGKLPPVSDGARAARSWRDHGDVGQPPRVPGWPFGTAVGAVSDKGVVRTRSPLLGWRHAGQGGRSRQGARG